MSTCARSNHRALRFEALENRCLLAATISGFDANLLPPQDDSPSAEVSLPFAVNFFGRRFDELWVNNNGNVTFDDSLSQYVPFGLSTSIGTPIIAAFFADVDTGDSDNPLGTVTYGVGTFEGHSAFGVTYSDVGYFDTNGDLRNSFQILIVDRSDIRSGPDGSDFDIVFNYDKIQWDKGDLTVRGTVPAVAGFSNGTGHFNTFFQIKGSLDDGAFLDSNRATGLIYGSRGSDTPGRYVFAIRGGQLKEEETVVVPVPYFPPSPVTPGFTFAGPVGDGVVPDVFGRTNVIVPGWEMAPIETGSASVRTIFGTGFADRLLQPRSSGADPADSIAVLPAKLPLMPSMVDQVQVHSGAEDPIVSLLAALPLEHEEVALNAQTAVISGQVWQDDDGDGRIDRLEQPLFKQQVFLDANGNGVLDAGERLVETDPTGFYTFTDLNDGVYLVRVAHFQVGGAPSRASEAIQIRIDMQKREFPDVNFAVPAQVGNEVATQPRTDQPRWSGWLAGAGAVVMFGMAGLLGYTWRRKRDAAYVVWHMRIDEGDSTSMRRSAISSAIEDTVCETEERDVPKNAP